MVVLNARREALTWGWLTTKLKAWVEPKLVCVCFYVFMCVCVSMIFRGLLIEPRTLPPTFSSRFLRTFWNQNKIHSCLVQVAHANTLRGLVKTIDNIGDEEIRDVAIPTGIPIVYNFKRLPSGELKSVSPKTQEHSVSQVNMKGQFLEKPGLLKVRSLYMFPSHSCRLVGLFPCRGSRCWNSSFYYFITVHLIHCFLVSRSIALDTALRKHWSWKMIG